jgi:transcriptional regulator GlxA family with amidase domain
VTLSERVRRVGIFLFDEVEVLDFAGPFEVFSTANRMLVRAGRGPGFEVLTISEKGGSVRARGGLETMTRHSLIEVSKLEVLIVPGGVVDAELAKPGVIQWIKSIDGGTELTASVCTGAFLLASAGILSGKRATTHWEDVALLRRDFPQVQVESGGRWVDEGHVITSAGISAGIDMSLHLVRRLVGGEIANATARQMEFDWEDRGR